MNPFKSLSEETRDKLWFLSLILFFPIVGLILFIKANKGCDFETFMDEWSVYLLLLVGWVVVVGLIGLIILGIIYNLVETLIIIGVIAGILFLFLGVPYIVYRISNLK
jgi:hypothetical protein